MDNYRLMSKSDDENLHPLHPSKCFVTEVGCHDHTATDPIMMGYRPTIPSHFFQQSSESVIL